MANINAHLPPAIAVPFHPPTENLHHDNLVKPVIPKTEVISSYTKFRDDQERTQLPAQQRDLIQNEGKQTANDASHQDASPRQKRSQFFARRGHHFISESEVNDTSLSAIEDFTQVMSVIQARYNNAVSPFPDPVVNYAI